MPDERPLQQDRPARTALLLACAALSGLMLLSFSLRVSGSWKSLNYDELASLHVSAPPIPEMMRNIVASDTHPPLYPLLIHFWQRINSSEVWIRLPSILFGTASCWFAYLISRRFTDRAHSMGALLIVATSPALIANSQFARNYSMMTFFVASSTYYLVRLIEHPKWSCRIAYVLLAVSGLYTFYVFAYALAAQNIAFIVCRWKEWKPFLRWLAGQACVAAAFAPWLPAFRQQAQTMSGADKPTPLSFARACLMWEEVFRSVDPLQPVHQHFVYVEVFCVAALGPLCYAFLRRKRIAGVAHGEAIRCLTFIMLLLAAVLTAMLAASLIAGVSLRRHYVGFAGVFFAAVFCYCLARGRKLRNLMDGKVWLGFVFLFSMVGSVLFVSLIATLFLHVFFSPIYTAFLALFTGVIATLVAGRFRPSVGAAIVLLLVVVNVAGLKTVYSYEEDVRGAAELLMQRVRSGDCIALVASYQSRLIGHYLSTDAPVYGLPDDIPGVEAKDGVVNEDDTQPVGETLGRHRHIWMVWSHVTRGPVDRGDAVMRQWFSRSGYHIVEKHRLPGILIDHYVRLSPGGQR